MKKYFTLVLITLLITTQKIKAQLDMAFISNFNVASANSINRLSWTTSNNQGANKFYVERCTNGKDFEIIAVLMATSRLGTESYNYCDTMASTEKIMYRLNILSKNQHTFYSKIVITQSKTSPDYSIKILGNPVSDKLSFNYTSKDIQQVHIKAYDLFGKPILDQKIKSIKGNNFITIPINSILAPGMYVIEIDNSILRLTTTFLKQ